MFIIGLETLRRAARLIAEGSMVFHEYVQNAVHIRQVLLSLSLVPVPIWRCGILASFNYSEFVTLLTDLLWPHAQMQTACQGAVGLAYSNNTRIEL